MENIPQHKAPEVKASRSPPRSPANSRRISTYYHMPGGATSPMATGPRSNIPRGFNEQRHAAQQSLAVDGLLPNPRNHHEASFPVKMHQLLGNSDERIIRWQPKNDGKSFTIVNCERFEAEVLPRLYNTANIEVFGRLLSLYGFQRVESGPYEGDYYHTLFVRDKPQLAHMMQKGGDAPVANPTTNPTAYAPMVMKHSLASSMHATVTSRLCGLNFPGKLHYLLCHGVYDLGLEGVMRWQPGGHAFAVYSSEDFEIQGLAEMLGTPGYASFRAQLLLHGFQRVRCDGPDAEAYYHADFVREQPQLCRLIRSRNHLKSGMIHRSPTTPTVSRRPMVSPSTPLSETSVGKSTICALPDSLFLDSRASLVLSPESGTKMKSNPHVRALPSCTSRVAIPSDALTDGQDKKEGAKQVRKRPRVGHMMPQNYFPFKIHSLLTLAEKFGFQHILCWAPHGRCFLVNDKDLFCATVLPLFRHSEFASFRAQLKAYGFVRIGKSGADKGAYYHTSFLRGKPELCATITRRPKNVNGTVRGRPKGKSYVEPNFYKMKFLPDVEVERCAAPPGNIKDTLEKALTQITPPAVVTRELATPAGAVGVASAQKATDGQAIRISRDTKDVVAKLVQQNDSTDTPLPVKLHALLNDAHDHSFNAIVKWNDSGRSFGFTDEEVFGDILCDKWLNIPNLAAFEAELEMYGFKRRQSGPHKGSYYHEMFHKALPHLCRCIKKEEPKAPATSDSSVDSQQVIVIDGGTRPTPVEASLSTLSAGSAGKPTNSPELEVAMALTAMDDRSAEREPTPMEGFDDMGPLPTANSNDRPTSTEASQRRSPLHSEIETKPGSSPPISPIKFNEPAAIKRKSIDEIETKPSLSLPISPMKFSAPAASKRKSIDESETKPGLSATISPIKFRAPAARKRRSIDPPDSRGPTRGETKGDEAEKAKTEHTAAKVNMEIDLTSDSDEVPTQEDTAQSSTLPSSGPATGETEESAVPEPSKASSPPPTDITNETEVSPAIQEHSNPPSLSSTAFPSETGESRSVEEPAKAPSPFPSESNSLQDSLDQEDLLKEQPPKKDEDEMPRHVAV